MYIKTKKMEFAKTVQYGGEEVGEYEQYCKLAGRHCQNRQKSKADNEADQGCHVTRAKDEQSIPSTDCSTKWLSVTNPHS